MDLNRQFPQMDGMSHIQDGPKTYQVLKLGECFLLIPVELEIVTASAEVNVKVKDCTTTVLNAVLTYANKGYQATGLVEFPDSQDFQSFGLKN